MTPKLSSAISRRNRYPAGFSLAEILVALALGSWVILAAAAGYIFVTHGWTEQRQRFVVERDLARAVARLSQSLRRAGVCLAWATQSVDARGLSSQHDADGSDTVIVRANPRCARAALLVPYNGKGVSGDSIVNLDNVQNFESGMAAYIMARPSFGVPHGERFVVKGVEASANQLIVSAGSISGSYPTEDRSVVVGLVEETFRIDRTGSVPVLTVESAQQRAIPVADHIETLRLRYVLNRVGRQCVVMTVPDESCFVSAPSEKDWALVRMIELSVIARSERPIRTSGGVLRLTSTTTITPRNFRF